MTNLAQLLGVNQRDGEIIAHYAGTDGKEELSVEQIAQKFDIPTTEVENIVMVNALAIRRRLLKHIC